MNEAELRALVREAIARQAGSFVSAGSPVSSCRDHSSHARLVLPASLESDGPCIIEPSVMCNHCGYCTSYGH